MLTWSSLFCVLNTIYYSVSQLGQTCWVCSPKVGCETILKVRSHQTRMRRITRMIYMLSQCKDTIDNPAVREWGGRVNQSGACSRSDVITSGGRKSETTMEDKVIVVVCGYPELYIHLPTFTKTGIHFAMRLELPSRSPIHDANSRLLCSKFHARISHVNESSKLKMFKRSTSRD